MSRISRSKTLTILASIILAIYLLLPNFQKAGEQNKYLLTEPLKLGLDLRGGAQLVLQVDFDHYQHDLLEQYQGELRKKLREEKLGYRDLARENLTIKFASLNPEDQEKIEKLIRKLNRQFLFTHNNNIWRLSFSDEYLQELRQQVQQQSIEIIRRRVDEVGNKEISLNTLGKNRIDLQVPGLENPDELKQLIGQTAKLTFHLVKENFNPDPNQKLPANIIILPLQEDSEVKLALNSEVLMAGDLLNDAQANFSQGKPIITFRLSPVGGRKFADITKRYTKQRLAIVLDNKVLSAPVINEPIIGGEGIIQGNFTAKSANELAVLLRAGALPAPIKVIEERSIGPSLGSDSVESGKKAVLLGFVLVVGFMIVYYHGLGVIASLGLVCNLLFLFAVLTWFQSTLTLPGIAGIVLTIGMAVDANVLIFERIKEELADNRSTMQAINNGFQRAYKAIVDSNITTLIVAFLLYMFGTGAIKGFAVTLSIGIAISMYSAVVITKFLTDIWYTRQTRL